MRFLRAVQSLCVFVVCAAAAACSGETPRIRLATTTSVQDSGLLGQLLPEFTRETGIAVDVVAVGTGAAFRIARDGNCDLLLVHDRRGEDEFIASGDGASRHDLMWNTFELLGPADDPARAAGAPSADEALRRIAAAGVPFVSRGDDSGTHRRELSLWKRAGDPAKGAWYQETGQGMGATLRVADERNAYVLTDQGTRLGYAGTLRLVPRVAGTEELKNHYAIVKISAARHPHVDVARADALTGWLLSPETAERIEAFRIGGTALFHPAAAAR